MTGEDKEYLNVQELNVGRPAGAGSSATNPTIAFGDGDTGIFEGADDTLTLTVEGVARYNISKDSIQTEASTGFSLQNEAATATNPTLVPIRSDPDSGIGSASADALSLISGGIEGLRLTEGSSHIIQSHDATVGITAHAGSAQGSGVILSSYNVYDTVGTAGDAATLPATFTVGTTIYIKNGAAANSMDVFPAAGDDAGAGANTAVAVAAGDFAVFLGTTANATWEKIMGGTA